MYMKEVMADPSHPDYDDVNEWFGLEDGEVFDPS